MNVYKICCLIILNSIIFSMGIYSFIKSLKENKTISGIFKILFTFLFSFVFTILLIGGEI
jgi:hypothetical protein